MRSNSTFVITPDSFKLSPAVIGMPLARPSRRLTAMLLDLLLVSLLVQTAGGFLLGMAAAYFAFRMAGRMMFWGTGPLGRMSRLSVRAFGAIMLFTMAMGIWEKASSAVKRVVGTQVSARAGSMEGGAAQVANAAGLGANMILLQNADSEDEARRVAPLVVSSLRGAGVTEAELRTTMNGVAEGAEQPWMDEVVASALQSAPAPRAAPKPAPARPARADSLAAAYAAASTAGDTAEMNAIGPLLGAQLAKDSLSKMNARVGELRGELKAAEVTIQEHRNESLLGRIRGLLDELGIGFGWTGLYFTAFLSLWKGQTPGKRLLGIRVVRLNGESITFWTAFERFGGYAAGLVTGLLGFGQVYWDRNRQMIHDKIVETVVIREKAARAPAPLRPLPAQGFADMRR